MSWALPLILPLVLAGCAGGGLGDLGKSPPTAYNLDAAGDFPRQSRSARGLLAIAEPVALSAYDGEKIVVRPNPAEAAQLGGAQWQDRLPKLMQARILQSFENAKRLRAVARPGDRVVADFLLMTEVRAFEISVAEGSAVVEIAAKIVSQRTGRIIAARVFRTSVPAAASEGAAAIAALNEAFMKMERELVLWTARVV
ncbi:MAG: ABC-type transport auxiliary lipoprotein family protein [Pseudolabrys sp.]|nr:ABC-type transport auxiliary lipoprotein family protein [Pseudolabrys sp.]